MDSCGPSNGAKSLQRHLAQDRTLHQDAITRHQAGTNAAAGFRAGPSQAAMQQADASLQAFGQESRDRGRGALGRPTHRVQAQGPHAWTGDFDRIQGGASQTMHQAPRQQQQPMDGWGADFLAFQEQQGHAQQQSAQQPQHMNAMYGMGSGLSMGFPRGMTAMQPMQQQPVQQPQQQPVVSEQAFTDAFAQAEQSVADMTLEQDESAHLQAMHRPGHDQADAPRYANQNEAVHHMTHQQQHLHDGTPVSNEAQRAVQHARENEALSRIAKDLINAVAADQEGRQADRQGDDTPAGISTEMADKFRNSNFMKLMHALRDGQVALTADGQGLADTITGAAVSIAEPAIEVPPMTEEDKAQAAEQFQRIAGMDNRPDGEGGSGGGRPGQLDGFTHDGGHGRGYHFDDSLEAMNDELALSM